MMGHKRERRPDQRRFVQVRSSPSVGIELTSATPWVGIDQQVGHFSADALFALTDQQYREFLHGWEHSGFAAECWRGEHPDLLLFHPGGAHPRPDDFRGHGQRMLSRAFEGELWWHLDALRSTEALDISRLLAGSGASHVEVESGAESIRFELGTDSPYPRPYALIDGVETGSTRAQVCAIVGDPITPGSDTHSVHDEFVDFEYVDGHLSVITVRRRPAATRPSGPVRRLLALLGTPEQGDHYRAWAGSVAPKYWGGVGGWSRPRLITLGDALELQVEKGEVMGVRVRCTRTPDSTPAVRAALAPSWPPTRDHIHEMLGKPSGHDRTSEIWRFEDCQVVVDYEDDGVARTATDLHVMQVGGYRRYRDDRAYYQGEQALFLDTLGLEGGHPVVTHLRTVDGVGVRLSRGRVSEIAVGPERFSVFGSEMPANPTRWDVPLPWPGWSGARDDLREVTDRGWIHVHCRDGEHVSAITFSAEEPRGLNVRPLSYREGDTWDVHGIARARAQARRRKPSRRIGRD